MKLKINSLHLKQIGLLLLLFFPIYLFLVKYGYGVVYYGISKKNYQHDIVTITLPWGWFSGRFKDGFPLGFLSYDQQNSVFFEFYDIDALDDNKYEQAITNHLKNSIQCYYSNINNNETFLFKKRFENKIVIFAYIPHIRLEIFYESEDGKQAKWIDEQHEKRIKRILSNIEVDKNGNKLYYDIDGSLKSTIYSKCEEFK